MKMTTQRVNQQTDPYRIHEQWTDDKNEDKSGEIIRFTMINTRLKNIQSIDDFENERTTVKKSWWLLRAGNLAFYWLKHFI